MPEATARPLVKWVGGKRQLLPALTPLLPASFDEYREPFVGGGAMFYHLRPRGAFLSDANARLVRAMWAVRDNVEAVIARLRAMPNEKTFFLKTRALDIDKASDNADVAAWFIYLNKTCYNGLYRVNRSNGFNAPFGGYTNPAICDADNLRACSVALKSASITCVSYECALAVAGRGSFAFLDPPYVPESDTAKFTNYGPDAWKMPDHERLVAACRRLDERGARFMLTNSGTALPLYEGHGWDIRFVDAKRNVNCNAAKRGAVREIVVRNYA